MLIKVKTLTGKETKIRAIFKKKFAKMSEESSLKHGKKPPDLNPAALADIEREACLIAKEFYKLNKNIQLSLNQISAASVCNMQTCQDTIQETCDSVEKCVAEESELRKKAADLSRSMEPIYKLQTKINTIKTLIINLDTQI
ncbi:hypothetical protein BpHYR1_010825 [Brachionus plicatilis]|uniref:BLOC-1-related complex subunit 6 C-terminal helix domain-containing protein n=1 Tax=Brachionus plicatilis TaxID=10195 RepID=A0A3M7R6U5_BRAPC|nr:hypothetical protein BpHYR1_010825 [Brachionus plicatilis]